MTTSSFDSVTSQRVSSRTCTTARFGVMPRRETGALGRVLSGRFRIERWIGMGAMGVVWEARHQELDTRVAIKAILPEMQAVPGMRELFAREAKAAAGLRSAHIPQVFDVGVDAALGPYMVMEYLEGRDLSALLDLDGPLPAAPAIDYVLQACEGLAVAHAQGVIHRDIKPGNLFLTRQGELEIVKLLDFGVSKAVLTGRLFGGELSGEESAAPRGTPAYMSPEQICAPELVDARSDIWAIGAVLYELVTGHSAFRQTGDMEVLLASICEDAPAPLSTYCSAPASLQSVIDRCLDKNPARRFQNVAELAYALSPLASSRSRLHAHRAASILAWPGEAAAAFRLPAMPRPVLAAPAGECSSGGPRGTHALPAMLASPQHQRRRRSAFRAALLLAVPLGLGALMLAGGGARWLAPLARAVRLDPAEAPLDARPTASPAARLESDEPRAAGSGAAPLRARDELQRPPQEPSARDAAAPTRAVQATRPSGVAARRTHSPPEAAPSSEASEPSGASAPTQQPSPERPRLRLVPDTAQRTTANRS